jgi:SAM-dependent methyltransferase
MAGANQHFAGPLATEDVEAIELFRRALEENNYTESGLRAALGPDMSPHLKRMDLPLYQRRLSTPGCLNALIKLFTLQLSVSEDAAQGALAPLSLERAAELGLIQCADKVVHGRITLSFCEGLWLAHDRLNEDAPRLSPDHVLGTNPAAATLAKLTVRRPARSALDVGTGCGVQALLAARHCDSVIAVDTNPRALNYAVFNARLNRLKNVEFRLGSLFGPVAHREFDLIVCNPPFVISPESAYLFRDSGLPGDKLSEEVVRAVPRHLAEGGFASVLCSWTHNQTEDWSLPLRPWVTDNGCDAWLLHGVTRDPLGYAASWNRGLDAVSYGDCLDRWQAYYQRLGIQALSLGAVVLRRRSSDRNWIRADELPETFVDSCSDHILRIAQAEDHLAAHANDEDLFAETFRMTEDQQVRQTFVSRDGQLLLDQVEAQLTRGLRLRGVLGPAVMQLLARCDGHRTLDQIAVQLAQAARSPAEEIRQQVGPLVRQLLSCGFLVPVGGIPASEFRPPGDGRRLDAQSTHALASCQPNNGGK